mgnify:CR=1 FL=1
MQEIIVVAIGILVLGYVIYQIYKTIFNKNADKNGCSGCSECNVDKN